MLPGTPILYAPGSTSLGRSGMRESRGSSASAAVMKIILLIFCTDGRHLGKGLGRRRVRWLIQWMDCGVNSRVAGDDVMEPKHLASSVVLDGLCECQSECAGLVG